MFGVHLLKKTDNKYLKQAIEESKYANLMSEKLMVDKIDELKLLRQNITQLTPKTVSSHNSLIDGLSEIDFNDPVAFKSAQLRLEEKQKAREEEKKRKREEAAKASQV